jgi:hypothetical protein
LHRRRFIDDLTAEFFSQTIDTVFVKHALPKGEMKHRGTPVNLAAIRRVGLLTVEGENDDISGIGQTLAAHDLCQILPPSMKANYLLEKVGHYGVFNGSRFRNEIVPRIREFHARISHPVATLKLVANVDPPDEARPRSIFWLRTAAVNGLAFPMAMQGPDEMCIPAFYNSPASWR